MSVCIICVAYTFRIVYTISIAFKHSLSLYQSATECKAYFLLNYYICKDIYNGENSVIAKKNCNTESIRYSLSWSEKKTVKNQIETTKLYVCTFRAKLLKRRRKKKIHIQTKFADTTNARSDFYSEQWQHYKVINSFESFYTRKNMQVMINTSWATQQKSFAKLPEHSNILRNSINTFGCKRAHFG